MDFVKNTTFFYSIILGDVGFPGGSDGKESACNAGNLHWILGPEDYLEKGIAIHFSFLAWTIPWTEESGRLYILWGL